MIKRKGEELAMVLLKEKMEIIKYELKYKQQHLQTGPSSISSESVQVPHFQLFRPQEFRWKSCETVMVIALTSSPGEFQNSWDHEKGHLCRHISQAFMHGLSAGRTINDTVEQVVKRAGVPLHNWWSAVNQLLNLIPFFRGHDGFMTVFNDFPFLTGNDVIGVGANPFLVRPKNQMHY